MMPKATLRLGLFAVLLLACGCLPACRRSSAQAGARYLDSGNQYAARKDYLRAVLQFRNAARLLPKSPEPYYRLGLAYLELNSTREAVAALTKATELSPSYAPAQLKLAELMILSRNDDLVRRAEQRVQKVLASAPDSNDAMVLLAATRMQQGKAEEAESILRDSLRKNPRHMMSSAAAAILRLGRKDAKGAREVLEQAIQQNPKDPSPRITLGAIAAGQGQPAEAEALFRQALQIDANNVSALLQLAALKLNTGQPQEAEKIYKQIAALPDKRYQPLFGLFLLERGRLPEAVAEFERLAKADPKDRWARARLISVLVGAKRNAEAQALVDAALKTNPNDQDALIIRCQMLLRAGKYEQAQQDVTKVLRLSPGSGEAHYLMAQILARRGSELQRQQELAEALRLNPILLGARLELAQALLAAQSPKSALAVLEEAPPEQKQSLPLMSARNWALIAVGNFDGARQGVDQALAVARVPEFLLQDSILKRVKRDFTGARSSLHEMLKQAPDDVRAVEALARTYQDQGQPAEAIAQLRQYAGAKTGSPKLHYLLGTWLLAAGKLEEARKEFETAKTGDPAYGEADMALAKVEISRNKHDVARSILTRLVQSGPPESVAKARLWLAMLDELDGSYPGAVEQYRKVLELQPANPTALNNLAYRLAEGSGSLDEALKYAQRARELYPNNAAYADTLGWILYKKGIYQMACAHLENAAAGDKRPLIQYHLAMAYAKTGQLERGRQVLSAALKADPNSGEARLAQQVFAEASRKASQ